jgi:hypothetical protein
LAGSCSKKLNAELFASDVFRDQVDQLVQLVAVSQFEKYRPLTALSRRPRQCVIVGEEVTTTSVSSSVAMRMTLTASLMTSAGRFSPLGPVGIHSAPQQLAEAPFSRAS